MRQAFSSNHNGFPCIVVYNIDGNIRHLRNMPIPESHTQIPLGEYAEICELTKSSKLIYSISYPTIQGPTVLTPTDFIPDILDLLGWSLRLYKENIDIVPKEVRPHIRWEYLVDILEFSQ